MSKATIGGVTFEVRRSSVKPGCFLTRYPNRTAMDKTPQTMWIPANAQAQVADLIRSGGLDREHMLETGQEEEDGE